MPDINDAIVSAINYAFDETIGYTMGGTFNPDTDCSGFVWQCLYDNGFNVGGSRFDTSNMGGVLEAAEFTKYTYSSGFQLQHGDILMWDEPDPDNPPYHKGHTFFYGENCFGYTSSDYDNGDGTTGTNAQARIEASSNRNRPAPGDQDNGHGMHPEVWSHPWTFNYSDGHTWYVYRYHGSPAPGPNLLQLLIMKKIIDRNYGRSL